jgi:hypothetical protein
MKARRLNLTRKLVQATPLHLAAVRAGNLVYPSTTPIATPMPKPILPPPITAYRY